MLAQEIVEFKKICLTLGFYLHEPEPGMKRVKEFGLKAR